MLPTWPFLGVSGLFVDGRGRVYPSSQSEGEETVPLGVTPAAPIVGMVSGKNVFGEWMVGSDGGVFTFGDAQFYRSIVGLPPGANHAAQDVEESLLLTQRR